ncbi:MAG: lactoylglutathione lyase [Pseudomonadota bacterium]
MRIDHQMMRVKDLDKSVDFYTRILGMQLLRQTEYPDGKFTNTFVGYQPEGEGTSLELTYNWDQEDDYEMGQGWGHLALMVDDVYATCDKLAAEGVTITRPAGPMKHGTRVIAFIEDPDGHKIELVGPRD